MRYSLIFKKLFYYCQICYKKVLNIVFPPICAYCRCFLEKETIFCNSCFSFVVPIVSSKVSITAKKEIKVFAISDYKDPIRSLILSKNRSDIVSSRQLGQLILNMTHIKNVKFDYIVPIPLHWTRFAKRGFNQAEEMANVISNETGRPVIHLLKRLKKTKYQASLKRVMREENLKNSFVLSNFNSEVFLNKHILIVDDLFTTGATLRNAAKELYKLKPALITLVVACRVV